MFDRRCQSFFHFYNEQIGIWHVFKLTRNAFHLLCICEFPGHPKLTPSLGSPVPPVCLFYLLFFVGSFWICLRDCKYLQLSSENKYSYVMYTICRFSLYPRGNDQFRFTLITLAQVRHGRLYNYSHCRVSI